VELDRLAQEIGRVENQLVSSRSQIAAHNERIAAGNRRIEEQQALRHRCLERQKADRDRLDEGRTELNRVQEAALKLAEQSDALQVAVTKLNEQDRVLARELADAQATLEDEKSGIIELLRRSAQLHNEIVRLNTHRESLVGQKGKLHQRGARISAELEQALESKAEFDQKLRVIENLIAEEAKRLEEKKAEAARVNHVRQRLVDELALAKERRSALLSRQELLQDLQRKMEGVGAGVRKVLDEKREGGQAPRHKAILGLLADLFETDVVHAPIIEAALDGRDQDLVVSACAEFLAEPAAFESLPGRLCAICDDRLPPIVQTPSLSDRPGFVAHVIELVRYQEEYRQLAWHLFGKVVLVENLDAALRLAHQEAEGYRFVTRRGEVVDSSGRIRLGPTSAETGLISRKSELREIGIQLRDLDDRIATLADQLDRTQTEAAHLENLQQELRNAIYESNAAKIEASSARQNVADTVERLTQEQPLIAHEVLLLEQEINEVLEKSTAGGRTLGQLDEENREREQGVARGQQRIDEIVERRTQVQEQLTQTKVSLGQLTEKRSATAESQNNLRRAISDLEAAILQSETDITQCAKVIDESQSAIAKGRDDLRGLAQAVDALEGDAARLRTQRDQLRINLDGLAHSIRAARSELADAESKLHEHQMAVAQVTVRRDDLVARVLDEMGVNLSERYLEYQHQEQDWERVEAEIAELRGKIDRLGNVNLDAINELKELEDRFNFLAQQREDLDLSIRQLTQLIETLNQESRERFRAAFEQIREHFRGLFRKLFGGGRADILLEDPENSLDSGIEIVAQPPGKELQTISLMSGGEKSMTAIALLMSIFKIRPAPFTILDEVDAALDEANNDRFNRIVREFVADSQFIIITHSKRTMNIADRLYGITMQEPGISTRVSVQLGQAEVA
jgi:chromosome segregation protein